MSNEPPKNIPDHISGMWPRLASKDGSTVHWRDALPEWSNRYYETLSAYLNTPEEGHLDMAGKLGREMVLADIPPEEIIEIHTTAVSRWAENRPDQPLLLANEATSIPLMEVMTAYGLAFREMQDRMHGMMEMKQHYRQIRHALGDTIEAITKVRETNDPYTAAHQRRVAMLACVIAERLGLGEDRLEGLRMAASLHDIGMTKMPTDIFTKASRLEKSEYERLKAHPQISYDLLKDVEFPWPIAEITLQHHERIDGSGYPRGLRDHEILLEAKIISVADTVEAMVSHRPYRTSHDIKEALTEIEAHRGSYFDSNVVDICCQIFKEKAFSFPND